jgi:hypothetical protein
MAAPILTLTGVSGTKYDFEVYSKDATFNAVGAVYAITKRDKNVDGKFNHTVIYIGQTKDLSIRFYDHHREACFDRKKWNCISVHRDDNEASRLKKEADLIAAHDPDCNRQ